MTKQYYMYHGVCSDGGHLTNIAIARRALTGGARYVTVLVIKTFPDRTATFSRYHTRIPSYADLLRWLKECEFRGPLPGGEPDVLVPGSEG